MAYVKKTDHIDEALGHLIQQFSDRPDLKKLAESWLTQIQGLEDTFSDILTKTTVENSTGAQLDALGAIVGELRRGRNDLQYSTAVRARLILNVSEGTTENLIDLIRGIAGEVRVDVQEFYPAAFIAVVMDPIDPEETDVTQLGALVASGRPAGVRGVVAFSTAPAFRFDTGPGYDEGGYGGAVLA